MRPVLCCLGAGSAAQQKPLLPVAPLYQEVTSQQVPYPRRHADKSELRRGEKCSQDNSLVPDLPSTLVILPWSMLSHARAWTVADQFPLTSLEARVIDVFLAMQGVVTFEARRFALGRKRWDVTSEQYLLWRSLL